MDFTLEGVLLEAQKLQREGFGKRHINVNISPSYVNVTVFEKDYEKKEDGDLKNFTFYEHMDKYAIEAEWKRLIDYYNG